MWAVRARFRRLRRVKWGNCSWLWFGFFLEFCHGMCLCLYKLLLAGVLFRLCVQCFLLRLLAIEPILQVRGYFYGGEGGKGGGGRGCLQLCII